ncbi:MAG: hypothetical protein Q8R04_03630, partial [Nanoarchaeota archaeon]|nr:hypothetical protein [Nanoarchaeota archaeon]
QYYNWSIRCIDVYGHKSLTDTRRFTVIVMTNFSSVTSVLINKDNITFERESYGKIIFFDTINLTGVSNVNDYIKIARNRVQIYADILPALNKTATIYLYNLTYSTPRIIRDGQVCPSTVCRIISYSDGNMVFTVTHPSTYYTEETPLPLLTKALFSILIVFGLIYYHIKKNKNN